MKRFFYLISVLAVAFAFTACENNEEGTPAGDPVLNLNPASLEFSGWAETKTVEIEANRAWTAEVSDQSWLTISPESYPSSGKLTKVNVAVTVTANDTDSSREGYVVFYLDGVETGFLEVLQKTKADSDKPEGEDAYPITWMNYQWTAGDRIKVGDIFEASCCVFANGLTNAVESETGENIRCDIGYTTGDTEPWEDGWTWQECYFNGDWGDNFHFQVKVLDLPEGEYTYTFRAYKVDIEEYTYAGYPDGLYDGVDHLFKKFYVSTGEMEDPFDYTGKEVTWANLQWYAAETINVGEFFEAGTKVLIPGITDHEEITGFDSSAISVEIGISLTETDPAAETGWTWISAYYNGDWGAEYFYQARTDLIETSGTYNYTFRIKLADNGYVYAGTAGLWNGVDNLVGTFTVVDPDAAPENPGEPENPELPGENEFAEYSVTWANVQWWASDALTSGNQFEAGTKILVPGLTDTHDSYATDQFEVEVGYGTESVPTGSSWVWSPVDFNADWGNEYYFQGKTEAITAPGTYYCTFRIRFAGKDYVYADMNGLWDGTSALGKIFTVSE